MTTNHTKIKIHFYRFVLLFLTVLFTACGNSGIRKQLPEMPALENLTPALKEQIQEANEKVLKKSSAENLGQLGMVYHSSAYYNEAEQCYKLAIEKDSKAWIWDYYLGFLKKEMGDSKASVDYFRQVAEINPDIYQAWYYAGEGFQNLNFNKEAITVYQKVANHDFSQVEATETNKRVDFFPLSTYAKYQLARIYLNTYQLESAESVLSEIINEQKSFGPAYRLIGNLYSMKGDSAFSKYFVVRANDLAPFSDPVDTLVDELAGISCSEMYLLKQIDLAEKSINAEWADQLATHALKCLPDNKYLISKVIKLYLKMDEFDKANSLADQHMKMYQDDFTEIKDVAGLFFDKKEFVTSLKYYSRAQELKPDDSSLKPQLAMCLWGTEKKDDAVNQTIAFLNESKNNKEALAEGISLLVMFEKIDLAKTYLQDMRKIAPESSEFLSFEGYFAQQNKQEEKAISFYKKAFAADSKNMNNVTNLIEILIYNEKWADALNYLREALATHPNEPYILERSGTLLITCQDKSLRNINMGKELSERAFYHTAILPDAMVSAGRSLVVAYATLKDYQTAKYYMSVVLDLAKRANIRKDMMDDLEALNTQLAAYN